MNKIEYNGKEIIDLDKVKKAVEDTATLEQTKVASDTVKKIVVCSEYPATEEEGTLYIKLEN